MNDTKIISFVLGCLVLGFMFLLAASYHDIQETPNAIYYPGEVCIIKVDDTITINQMLDYTDYCVIQHQNYLLTQE